MLKRYTECIEILGLDGDYVSDYDYDDDNYSDYDKDSNIIEMCEELILEGNKNSKNFLEDGTVMI